MSRFVSKPVEIEAMQWNTAKIIRTNLGEGTAEQIVAWVLANGGEARYSVGMTRSNDWHDGPCIMVRTNSGWSPVAPGWWIVKGSETFRAFPWKGGPACDVLDHYPCDPDTFAKRWQAIA